MFSALQNVVPSHLMDTTLFPFQTIRATGEASEDGDKAFDFEPLPSPMPQPASEAVSITSHFDEPGNALPRKAVIPISTAH
jgi:tRNA 2-thiocytidine biosynthesis protein TtcA